jgi:hypothetical protein
MIEGSGSVPLTNGSGRPETKPYESSGSGTLEPTTFKIPVKALVLRKKGNGEEKKGQVFIFLGSQILNGIFFWLLQPGEARNLLLVNYALKLKDRTTS